MSSGKIAQVIGPVVDVEFPAGQAAQDPERPQGHEPEHLRPAKDNLTLEVAQHLGENDGPRHRHGLDRRPRPRHGGPRHGRAHRDARRPGVPRPHPQRHRRAGRRRPARSSATKTLAHPPRRRPTFVDQSTKVEVFETGIKVIDLLAPYRKGGKIGLFGGAGVGKTVLIHGAHQQRRQGARRRVLLRRRRRAHPRGQRPLPRDERVQARDRRAGHLQDGPHLRPDERAAGRPRPRRALGAHRRRVLPRRGGAGRAPLRRQHLPLHAGRLRGVRAPRPHPERRRLPAHALDRDGRPPGAHHLDQQGLDHQRPGHLRPRRRPHRPGAGDDVRPPRRDHRAHRAPHARSASTRPSTRSTRPRRCSTRRSSASATTTSPARSSRRSRSTRICRTSSPSSAWTSSARTTSSSSPAPARSSASSRSRSSSPRSSPASPGKLRAAQGHHRRLRGDRRGQARPHLRAGLLHGRQHRRGEGASAAKAA